MSVGDKKSRGELSPSQLETEIEKLNRLATVLDSWVTLPGTNIGVGLDALLGLVPAVGDLVMGAVSASIVFRAWRLGVSSKVLLQMIFNSSLDFLLGSVPVAGDAFDVFWKANLRNLELLREDLRERAENMRETTSKPQM